MRNKKFHEMHNRQKLKAKAWIDKQPKNTQKIIGHYIGSYIIPQIREQARASSRMFSNSDIDRVAEITYLAYEANLKKEWKDAGNEKQEMYRKVASELLSSLSLKSEDEVRRATADEIQTGLIAEFRSDKSKSELTAILRPYFKEAIASWLESERTRLQTEIDKCHAKESKYTKEHKHPHSFSWWNKKYKDD